MICALSRHLTPCNAIRRGVATVLYILRGYSMKIRFMNKLLFSLIVVTSLTFIMPTASPAADTIKLGVAGAHSGDLASYGIPTVRAAELVVRDINEKGGIMGKKVELLVEDDVCKPEVATNTATKLVSQGAHAVLGHICSGATKSALGIYKEAKIIALSPSATNTELTQSGKYPNFYRTIGYDRNQAKLAVDFTLKNLKVRKIAVLHDKGDYGKGFAEIANKYIRDSKKADVVLFEGITSGAVDYSAVVQKIKQSGADAVIYGGYHICYEFLYISKASSTGFLSCTIALTAFIIPTGRSLWNILRPISTPIAPLDTAS